jgi:hypothetical protein
MENKSVIEQWIEENRKMHWVAYYTACKELLSYLGLQDQPDPKLEIEALRQMQQDYATKTADLIIARAENERLKKALKKIKYMTVRKYSIEDNGPELKKAIEIAKQVLNELAHLI